MSQDKEYEFTDDPMIAGISNCDPDIVNDNMMYLKKKSDEHTQDINNSVVFKIWSDPQT